MKTFETPTVHVSVLDDEVVLVVARAGVNIDAASSRRDNEAIAAAMPGNYGMIIDRQEDYSIVPERVYAVLNGMERLKAIALVAHREITKMTAPAERPFYRGRFAVFTSIEEAAAWIRNVLHG